MPHFFIKSKDIEGPKINIIDENNVFHILNINRLFV